MKTLLILCFLIPFASLAKATSPTTLIVPQPANLVTGSFPGCIPITYSVCFANFHATIYKMISAPRPFIQGAREWEKGTESNHNLASVFGIDINPAGGLPYFSDPIEIHIKDWNPPAYSPHTKTEVLAATIHCLLLASRPTADHPLEVRIITQNKDDQVWAASFAKKYVTHPGKDQKPIPPTSVGSSILKTDGYGIQYVIFPDKNPEHLPPREAPVILPMSGGGRGSDGRFPYFIPVWPGNDSSQALKSPILSLAKPQGHFYNLFTSVPLFSMELNPLLSQDKALSIHSKLEDDYVAISMTTSNSSLGSLASAILAAAMTAKINHNKPIRLAINFYGKEEIMEQLLKTPGWEKTKIGNRMATTTLIDYDPKTKSLVKGTLPGALAISSYPDGKIYLKRKTK